MTADPRASAHDELLRFLSEMGNGEWAQLRDAYNWLALDERRAIDEAADKAWIAARDLSALGHIEVAWDEHLSWAAAPSLVTMLPRSGGRALITGARTSHFRERLRDAVGRLDLWPEEISQARGPSTLLVSCDDHDDPQRLAEALGVTYTYSVAEQVASLLPPLEAYGRLFEPGELPHGFDAQVFDPATLYWNDTDEINEAGLYRCRTFSGEAYRLLRPTGTWVRAPKELGIYEVLRWHGTRTIEYSEEAWELRVRAAAALPALHARAATLCTGRLPFPYAETVRSHQRITWLVYRNVPRKVAEGIASALKQEILEG